MERTFLLLPPGPAQFRWHSKDRVPFRRHPAASLAVMTIDFRTRDDVDVETIDVADFFGTQLPRLAVERSSLAVPGARELGVRPLTIETTAGTWTLSVDDNAVRVRSASGGRATVRLDVDEITDIVHDRRTPMTLLAAATLDMPTGDINDFLDWWVVLRSLLDARSVHTAGDISFTDRDGGPLDLHRSLRSTTIRPSWRTTSARRAISI